MSNEILALLVEDDDRLAQFTAEFLEQNGVAVTRVSDGDAALRAARARSFDVVILDLMLPRVDGLEVCRELRARSAVPILVVTARTSEADRVVGLELGAERHGRSRGRAIVLSSEYFETVASRLARSSRNHRAHRYPGTSRVSSWLR